MSKSVNDITSTTQQYLDIYDVSNDFLILKDGSTSLILTVSAMNFGLLAEEEQDAIMYAYAGLLNSLNYPIQIVIRSQTKDVTSYLQLLKEEEDKTVSDTRRGWIARYRQFVGELIRERNVLDKKFYVAIPASSLEMGLLPPSTVLPGVKQIDISKIERSVILEKAREILEPKRDYLIAQFGRIGLQSRQLTTQEIIQFFYLSYNPEAAEGQQITDTNSYTTALVQASMQGGFMDNVMQPMAPAPQPQQPQQPLQPQQPQAVQPIPATQPTPVMPEQPLTQPQQPLQQVAPQPFQPVQPIQPAQPMMQQIPEQMPAAPLQQPQSVQPIPATQPTPTPLQAPVTTPVQPVQQTAPTPPQTIQTPAVSTPANTQPVEPALQVSTDTTPSKIEDVQNQINSTLQELGQEVNGGENTTTSQTIPPVEPVVVSQSTPPQPEVAGQTSQNTDQKSSTDVPLPELPEI